jgi:hypothetical protein
MNDNSSVICVDLDGVLNAFDGWRGADFFHAPRPGSREFLKSLNDRGYKVDVFTCRWPPHVEGWLRQHGMSEYVAEVTNVKPAAHAYVDDRAICFRGDFEETLAEVGGFRAHWESKT